jgi:hypothetical protein
MQQTFFALSLGFAGLVLATDRALGQPAPQCGPRAEVTAQLAERYGESRRAIGIAANTALVELFASDQTGTWTITVTGPDGTACLVASGEAFEAIAEAPSRPGEPA